MSRRHDYREAQNAAEVAELTSLQLRRVATSTDNLVVALGAMALNDLISAPSIILTGTDASGHPVTAFEQFILSAAGYGIGRLIFMRRIVVSQRTPTGRELLGLSEELPEVPIIAGNAHKTVGGVSQSGVQVTSSAGGEILPMSVVRFIQKGENIDDLVNDIKGLTWQTGNEHAVVTLASGQRAIVSGGPGGIRFAEGEIATLFGHTHPTSAPPSSADAAALRQLGQSQQTVLHGGQVTKVRPKE